jgi:adenine-specific DNA-methyltransferase
MDNNRIPSGSPDFTQDNIEKLKELFPEIVTEGKVDFDMLKTVLGEEVDDRNERYRFEWNGKKESLLGAQQPSKGTLRPDKKASKNFDTTENLYIEGDNLEVLKLLQKSYNGKVKMIYIDPPYNTGNDFVYEDDFKDNMQNYLEQTGQLDETGRKLSTNAESSGRFHTKWLNMMYPRLKLARNLLAEDGAIFISIDDKEVNNLKKICDEIFGSENALIPFIWELPRGINAGLIARSHEYILCYTKKRSKLDYFYPLLDDRYSIDRCNKKIDERHPESVIEFPAGIRYEGSDKVISGTIEGSERVSIDGEMIFENGLLQNPVSISAGWTMKNMIQDWIKGKEVYDSKGQKIVEFFFKENGKLYSKKEVSTMSIKSVLKNIPDTQIARKEMEKLFGSQDVFSYPKTKELSKLLGKICTKDNDILMDFFSGSGTTAQAIMELNAENGGGRKFIMVQLPEEVNKKSEAYKMGYQNISEIGQERIRRAGKKIMKEHSDEAVRLDIGFKVLKLDKSNIREWNVDFEELEEQMTSYDNMFVPGRSELDIVYEIMLKYGLELTYPVDSFKVNGKNVYDIGVGNLFICLDDNIDTAVAQAIIDKRNEHGIETSSVVLADHGFNGNDSEKLNCFKLLQDADYQHEQLMTI